MTLISPDSSDHWSATSIPIPVVFSICFSVGHLTAAAWTELALQFCHSPSAILWCLPPLASLACALPILGGRSHLIWAPFYLLILYTDVSTFLSTLYKYLSFHSDCLQYLLQQTGKYTTPKVLEIPFHVPWPSKAVINRIWWNKARLVGVPIKSPQITQMSLWTVSYILEVC